MRRLIAAAIAAILSLACSFGALAADNNFPTPGNATAPGAVQMCLNASGQAVPVSNGTCANPVAGTAGFPSGATPIAGNGTGSTGAVVGTLAAAAGKTTYLCQFDVQAVGGTAAVGPITIAGLLGGSRTYQATSNATGGQVAGASFTPCLPASAPNTAITITTTADGTATAVDVNSSGFQL